MALEDGPRPLLVARRDIISQRAIDAFKLADYRLRHGRRFDRWSEDRRINYCLAYAFDAARTAHNLRRTETMIEKKPAAPKYWAGEPGECDFSNIGRDKGHDMTTFVDGRTKGGPWANMCMSCWSTQGIGRLGTGYGQKYEKREVGGKARWLKVEG